MSIFQLDAFLLWTNGALIIIGTALEIVNAFMDWRCGRALYILRAGGVAILLLGSSIYLLALVQGNFPPLTPLRVANTLILIYLDLRGSYDILSR